MAAAHSDLPDAQQQAPLVLEISNLHTHFEGTQTVRAVDGVSFDVRRGEILALVGESGCGKSVTALSAMRLVRPPGRIVRGSIRLDGQDLLTLDEHAMRKIRGNRLSMIFQEPMTALNPVLTIGRQLTETLQLHEGLSTADARVRGEAMLEMVALSDPARRLRQYPHQLSGGMRQRAMIAMAMACKPAVLFADEPTTALDVTIQAQILALLRDLADRTGTGIVLITHDLGVVAEAADRVVVMYAGRKVEEGPVGGVLGAPAHPYTQGLLASKPSLDDILAGRAPDRLAEIAGRVPALTTPLASCAFEPRCSASSTLCRAAPELSVQQGERLVACHHPIGRRART